jgi:hypothetical protein
MNRYENIPEELKTLKQWVCSHDDTKVPFQSTENKAASSTNPETWSSFDTAFTAVSEGRYDYCGFVFADNGIVGIDVDDGYDREGFISPLATNIIRACGSYTEKSRSGRGFHIILKGTLPFKGKNNLAGVEIYKASRYFIMTGDVLLYCNMIENQPAIDYVLETYFPEARSESNSQYNGNRIYSPVWQLPKDGRIMVRPHYPPIKPGSRNISLTSLAGQMHNQGYSFNEIFKELLFVNETKCTPPLDMGEVLTITKSVVRYRR